MTGDIDYRAVAIPEDTAPENYTYAERRAEILQRVGDIGSPRLLNGADLAARYGCTRQNIANDFDRLAEWMDDASGDRERLNAEALYWRCIRGLLEQGEYRDAARTLSEYHDWLHERQDLDELWERLDEVEAVQADAQSGDDDRSTSDFRVK
jgi:hypothetical protein